MDDPTLPAAQSHLRGRPVPLDEIIITEALATRPHRAANFEVENRVLTDLLQLLAAESGDVLQRLVDETLIACRAHSAGISLLERTSDHYLWRAVAGEWKAFVGARGERAISPSVIAIEREAPILLAAPHRHFAFPSNLQPSIHEVLLVPIYVAGTPVGTLWVIAHDAERKFDLEDLRVLTSLSKFAATAHQLLTAHDLQREATERLLAKTSELNRLAETSAIGLTWCGTDLRYKLVNRAYAQMVGIEQHELVGRTLCEVLGSAAWETIVPHVERVLRGEPVQYEAEIMLRGRSRCIHVNYMPDVDENGGVAGWIASVMDVTDRRRGEAALKRNAQQKDALYQFADHLHRTSSMTEVFDAALQAIIAAIQCDRASILLFDEAGVMRFVGWLGLSDAYRKATEGHSPWTTEESNPHPIGVDDVASEPLDDWLKTTILNEGVAALAFVPLVANGRLIGKFMMYYDAPHTFSADELDLALTIARQLAFAIDRQRAQQMLRSHAEQLALITDTAPVYIAYCDTQARFRFVNKAYAERLGLTPEECAGKTIAQIIGQRAYEQVRRYVEQVLSGSPAEFEVTVPYRQLGERYMHCSYAPQFDTNGKVIAFVAAITDITDRRRAEDALRDSEEKLRQADRRKDEFLAMLAHELRNPLAPIANAIHLLNRDPAKDPVHRQAQAIIERQAGRLARLVDDLLEVSRISTGRIQLHMERVAISGIIERAVETTRPLIEQHRHRLTVSLPEQPIWLDADATRLEQVIVNLLNNAAKYTYDGGRIALSVQLEGAEAMVQVTDNGIGIDPELLPRVFDLFTQAERTLDRSRGGLGIGLSLVERLVNMHGGEVTAESEVGRGSTFTVRLPVVDGKVSLPIVAVDSASVASTRSLRVLIVDDNVDAAQTLGMVLEMSGHEVTLAHTGSAAIEKVRAAKPQVVLLDIGLPEIDGYEVARRVRAESSKPPVLVAMTGYGQEADKEQARAAGFDHHLVKPANIGDIESILETVF